MTINISEIQSIKVVNFIENKNYEVSIAPGDMVVTGWGFRLKPAKCYNISKPAYPGITHNEDYITKLGLVIHDRKVCYPPKLIIQYKSGLKHVFRYSTYQKAVETKNTILALNPNLIELN